MYASSVRRPLVFEAYLFRWAARASAVILFAAWLTYVIVESTRGFGGPSIATYYQAAALAIVFAGYAIGWRKELWGGLIAILGTLAFFVVHVLTLGVMPAFAAAWFAAPGILFIAAWLAEKSGHAPQGRQS